MITATSPPPQTLSGEQRVVFHNVSWTNYRQISQLLPQNRHSRLSYESGTLEITMPLEDHEFFLRLIELFVRILVGETGMKMKTMGSTTINRDDLEKGAEPDCAYYIQNQPQVTGRNVNFQIDPPPDLVVEVDITHTDINKLRLYASIGVPELWRYNGKVLRIFRLESEGYQECDHSPTFPLMKKEDLYDFLNESFQDEIVAEQQLREYIRTLLSQN